MLDGARVAKIDAHPIDGIRDIRILRPNFLDRCVVLRIPGQEIMVSFIPEVKEAAHGSEESERRIHRRLVRGRKICLRTGPAGMLFHGRHGGKPARRDVVLKTARTILHIRLEMEHRVRKLAVAVARQFRQAFDHGLGLLDHEIGN